MASAGDFQLAQGLSVLSPKNDQAFPIPCAEWDSIKAKVEKLELEPFAFQNLGSILVGAAVATIISIYTGQFAGEEKAGALIAAWAVFWSTLAIGVAFWAFAWKEGARHREKARDIVLQMKLIEQRFSRD